ncbi:thioesterase II family protein [Azospirillum doebereinerae]|uniref:thioesterase II family protein n=1 Tax=Azospirillum doebereinerae TaxID=92933 RepID=UPI001EE5AE3D|nr:thioesterase domain-containing protein [Azospirillum doebereinerae]MCG5240289.1 thioesterase domain-containing protein [Azospirillum doebereinerae]
MLREHEEALYAPDSPWLVRFNRRARPALRLFVFPFAGGSAMHYHRWPRLVPDEVDLVGIQYPGRCSRLTEPGLTEFATLVEGARHAVEPLLDVDRIAFFGHSLGALVAFELTRSLRAHGQRQPDHLFLSARGAPDSPATGSVPDTLSDADLIRFLKRLGGTPDTMLNDAGVMAMILPGLRADLEALTTWRPPAGDPLALPVTTLAGIDDHAFPPDSLAGWARATTGPFAARLFPGGHFYLTDHNEAALDVVLGAFGLSRSDPR